MNASPLEIRVPAQPAAAAPLGHGEALSIEREAKVLWALRRKLVRGSLTRMLQAARLRISLVLVLSVVFWGALYFLFFCRVSALLCQHVSSGGGVGIFSTRSLPR